MMEEIFIGLKICKKREWNITRLEEDLQQETLLRSRRILNYKTLNFSKTYLITGAAGFIGYYLSRKLLEQGCRVIGIDNINDYYDVNLKRTRLGQLEPYEKFTFIKGDISDKDMVMMTFEEYKPDIVVNLAAQAGVRFSIENPDVYIQSNIIGFYNILEACRYNPVEHLIYASSSSVYGVNKRFHLKKQTL